MRIALLSDIHANLPALEVCLEDLERQKPDQVYCLGDLVGYNAWPNEVVELIRLRMIPTITGNYDFGVGQGSDDCGCAYRSVEEKELGKESIRLTNELISEENRAYLRRLPSQIRISFGEGVGASELLMVHGSPRRINEYLFQDRDEKSFWRIMKESNSDVLCFGHTHIPFHRILQDPGSSGERRRHAINTGSVGKPKDGDPRSCYLLLELDDRGVQPGGAGVRAEFRRISYDVDKAARALVDAGLPYQYGERLHQGR